MSDVAKTIIAAKESKGMTWEAIGEAVGMSPVWSRLSFLTD